MKISFLAMTSMVLRYKPYDNLRPVEGIPGTFTEIHQKSGQYT